jgi:hypothetical protein
MSRARALSGRLGLGLGETRGRTDECVIARVIGAIPRSPDEGVRGAPGAMLRGEVLRERGGGTRE